MPKTEKVALSFRVDPDWLKNKTYVPDGICIVATGRNPSKFIDKRILGGSGLDMWFRGFPFTFTKKLADDLIHKGFAKIYVKPKKPQ